MLVKKQQSEVEVETVAEVVMVVLKMVKMDHKHHQRLVFSFLREQLF